MGRWRILAPRGSRCRRLALVFLVVPTMAAGAQEPVRLKGRFEPYVGSLSRDYPLVGLAIRARGRPDSSSRAPYSHEAYVAGGVTFKGGVKAQAHFRAPALTPDYRLAASATVIRKARFFFPGLGNETEFDRSIEKHGLPNYYSVWRNRTTVRVETTRWVGSGFGVALGLGVEDASFTSLVDASAFHERFGRSLRETDANAGLTALYDRRDSETIPARGVLVQTGIQLGTGAGTYSRVFGIAQGYLTLRRGTVVAFRGAAMALNGDPPLVARFEVPTWERQLSVFGGDDSHRGLPGNRFVGAAVWLANAELRQDLGVVRRQTVWIVGMVDAGRIFEDESFRLTADGAKLSAGVGLALRGARERLGAAIAAYGPDGLRISLVSGWPF